MLLLFSDSRPRVQLYLFWLQPAEPTQTVQRQRNTFLLCFLSLTSALCGPQRERGVWKTTPWNLESWAIRFKELLYYFWSQVYKHPKLNLDPFLLPWDENLIFKCTSHLFHRKQLGIKQVMRWIIGKLRLKLKYNGWSNSQWLWMFKTGNKQTF